MSSKWGFFFFSHVSKLFCVCLMCIWVYLASVPLFVPNPPACCFKVLQSCTNIQSVQKLKQEGEDKLSRAYFVTQHKQMYGTQRRGDHDRHSFQACCCAAWHRFVTTATMMSRRPPSLCSPGPHFSRDFDICFTSRRRVPAEPRVAWERRWHASARTSFVPPAFGVNCNVWNVT